MHHVTATGTAPFDLAYAADASWDEPRSYNRLSMLRPSIVAVLLLLFLAQPAAAQTCRIEGRVTAAGGPPFSAVALTLIAPQLKPPRSTTANDDGNYTFASLPCGMWIELRIFDRGRLIAREFGLVTGIEKLNVVVPPDSATPHGREDLDPMGGDATEVRGVVTAADGTPLAGAHVSIADTGIVATTDSAGRYSFGHVRARLSLTLQADARGFESARQRITVADIDSSDAHFALTNQSWRGRDDLNDTFDSPPDWASFVVNRQQVRTLPTLAAADIFAAGQFLPGSVIPGSVEFLLRGETPDQPRVTVDGFTWYSYAGLFAGLPPLNAATVQSADYGALPRDSAGGGRITGTTVVSTVPRARELSANAEFASWGAAGDVAVPLWRFGTIAAGGRQSWPNHMYENFLDRFAGHEEYFRERVPRFSGGLLTQHRPPHFGEVNVRAGITPGARDRLSVSFHSARDSGNSSRDILLPPAPADLMIPTETDTPDGAAVEVGDSQTWSGRGGSVRWDRQWSTFGTTATLARSRSSIASDRAYFMTSRITGGDYSYSAGRSGSDALTQRSNVQDTTLRFVASAVAGFRHAIEVGFERVLMAADSEIREEVRAALVPAIVRTASSTASAVFARDEWRVTTRLSVAPGLRVSHDRLSAVTHVEPRAFVNYAAVPGVVLKAGWSADHQPTNRIVREDRQHGDTSFWALSDGVTIPVARAQQGSAGVSVDLPGVLFDGRLYYRSLSDLTLFAARPLPGVASTTVGNPWRGGSGTAAALQLLLQHRAARNSLWVGYSASRVTYRFPTLEAAVFPASFDRLHQLKVTDSARLRGNWMVTAAWRAASGLPYTPVTGVESIWFASGQLNNQLTYGAKNSGRLAPFHQLDISTTIARQVGRLRATLGATVFNVYDRRNQAGYLYELFGNQEHVSEALVGRRAADIFLRMAF